MRELLAGERLGQQVRCVEGNQCSDNRTCAENGHSGECLVPKFATLLLHTQEVDSSQPQNSNGGIIKHAKEILQHSQAIVCCETPSFLL